MHVTSLDIEENENQLDFMLVCYSRSRLFTQFSPAVAVTHPVMFAQFLSLFRFSSIGRH